MSSDVENTEGPVGQYGAAKMYWLISSSIACVIVLLNVLTALSFRESRSHDVIVGEFRLHQPTGAKSEFYVKGVSETLLSQLSSVRSLKLYSSNPPKNHIRIDGEVVLSEGRIEIYYFLGRPETTGVISSGEVTGPESDILVLQDVLAVEVKQHLEQAIDEGKGKPVPINKKDGEIAIVFYRQGLEYLGVPVGETSLDKAIDLFSSALLHKPTLSGAGDALCRAYLKKYSLSFDDRWAAAARGTCRNTAVDGLAVGEMYLSSGRYSDAAAYFQSLVEKEVQSEDVLLGLARAYIGLNDSLQAETLLETLVRDSPESWAAHSTLGFFYMMSGNLERSYSAYQKASSLAPSSASIQNNLGAALFLRGDFRRARYELERAISLEPNSAAFSNLGTLYYHQGDFQSARRVYQVAQRLSPKDYRYYFHIADTEKQIGVASEEALKDLYVKGISLANKALEHNATNAVVHQYLATGYLSLNQGLAGERHLEAALEQRPDDVNVVYAATLFWSTAKNDVKALRYLKKLVSLGYPSKLILTDPGFNKIRRLPMAETILARAP